MPVAPSPTATRTTISATRVMRSGTRGARDGAARAGGPPSMVPALSFSGEAPAGASPANDSAGTIEGGPPALAAPSRAPRVPLRITLVALMVVLVAVGLGATGITATKLLKDY